MTSTSPFPGAGNCDICKACTDEQVDFFSDGDCESGPYSWTIYRHHACETKHSAEMDAMADAMDAYYQAQYDAMTPDEQAAYDAYCERDYEDHLARG